MSSYRVNRCPRLEMADIPAPHYPEPGGCYPSTELEYWPILPEIADQVEVGSSPLLGFDLPEEPALRERLDQQDGEVVEMILCLFG